MAGQQMDPTGERKGALKRGWEKTEPARKWAAEHLPFTHARKRAKSRLEEEGRLEAQRQAELQKQAAERTPKGESGGLAGSELNDFSVAFIDAVRRGQRRMDSLSTSDMDIRRVVCDPAFIKAIANGVPPTPLEEVDTRYADDMGKVREVLVQKLRAGSIDRITTHELEILYVTMLNPAWTTGDVWSRDRGSNPSEAFFNFLETLAQRVAPEREGAFIGKVLATLVEKRTMTESSKNAPRTLVDRGFVDAYLTERSARPVERTVAEFSSLVNEVLTAPTSELHPVLGVPGVAVGVEESRTVARRLEDMFRHLLLENRESEADLKAVPDKFKGIVNPEVTKLLDEAQELLEKRESLAALVSSPDRKDAGAVSAEQEANWVRNHRLRQFEERVQKFEISIESARLPEQTKTELRGVVIAIKNLGVTKGFVEARLKEVKDTQAYPARRAAQLAVRKLQDTNGQRMLGEISDDQWIMARTIWESTGKGMQKANVGEEGFWENLRNGTVNLFTGRLPKNPVARYPLQAVMLVPYYIPKWILKATVLNTNFKRRNRNQWIYSTKEDGTKDKPVIRRKFLGLAQAGLITAALMQIGFAASTTVHNSRSVRDGLAAHFWRFPVQVSVVPFTWMRPVAQDRTPHRLVYDDDVNIPERLSERGQDHYRRTYGVNNDEALRWLQNHQDVLQFFQERRTLVHVTSWRTLPENPQTCRPNQQQVVACNLLDMRTERIEDGLKLNVHKSDEFVQHLRSLEQGTQGQGGQRITYAFLVENRRVWEQRGFLIPQREEQVMREYGVRVHENAQFLLAQLDGATSALAPRVSLGASREYIVPEHRDEFVTLWRQTASGVAGGANPAVQTVPAEVLRATFEQTKTAATQRGWVRDSTPEFERAQIMHQVERLHLRTQTAMDALVAQPDVRSMVVQFANQGAAYVVNPARADDFVQLLVEHKSSGGNIQDFNPFTQPQGSRVNWATSMGYISSAEVFQGQGAAREGSTNAALETSPQLLTFYASTERSGQLDAALKATLDALYEDARAGPVMRAAFGGDRARTESAVRAEVFRLLTSNNDRDRMLRQQYGITVSGEGDGMHVQMDARRAREFSTYVLNFVRPRPSPNTAGTPRQ